VATKTDYLIGLAMIVGPWFVGALAGYRFGRTWGGLVATITLGLALTALGLLGFFLAAPTSEPLDCEGCVEHFGRWLDSTLVKEWPLYTAVAWSLSAIAAGTLAPHADGYRPPGRETP
jgi:hypothetical protein